MDDWLSQTIKIKVEEDVEYEPSIVMDMAGIWWSGVVNNRLYQYGDWDVLWEWVSIWCDYDQVY